MKLICRLILCLLLININLVNARCGCATVNKIIDPKNSYFIILEFTTPTNAAIKKVELNLKKQIKNIMKKDVFAIEDNPHITIMYHFLSTQKKAEDCINKSVNKFKKKVSNYKFVLNPGAKFFNEFIALVYNAKSSTVLQSLAKYLSDCLIGSSTNVTKHTSLGTFNYNKNKLTKTQSAQLLKLFKTIAVNKNIILARIVLNQHTSNGGVKRIYTKNI